MKPLRNNIQVKIEEVNDNGTFSTGTTQVYIAEAIGTGVVDVKPGDILKIVPKTLVGNDIVFVSEDNVLAIIRGNQ